MTVLPGVGGTLFPTQFLSHGLEEAHWHAALPDLERQRRQFHGWWNRVAATCGPATGIRALFDLVAMPLAGLAGFRARDAEFDRSHAIARLETAGGATVSLMVLPWASRPSAAWRELADLARRIGSDWTIVIAPPFVSVVPTRGYGVRRSVDFRLPDALDVRSFSRFRTICRASAFEKPLIEGQPGWLEQLVTRGITFQDRVGADLQHGVVEALGALGSALARPRASAVGLAEFDEALTLVYRVLFLLFAESRDLVPRAHPAYGPAYSIAALSRAALNGLPRTGLWEGLAAITRLSRAGCHTDDLIVRPFNGRLFARAAAPTLEAHRSTRLPTRASKTRDDAIGRALLSLASRPGNGGRQEIAYADLGVEQLGAVYERVLDLDPAVLLGRMRAAPSRLRHSQRRKESGTFYTPQPLAEFVVRRTLAPLVAGASPEQILALRVVDPAMGSGAFLVAACRFLAGAYERALIEDGHAASADFDADERAAIRRLVAERCLAGVDANPLAVQLARLSLWLATLAQGKPLGFLDHRLRVGNSLLGAFPDDLARVGRPGRGRARTDPRLPFHALDDLEQTMRQVQRPLGELAHRGDDTVRDVRAKEAIWSQLSGSGSPLEPWRLACSLWCARWFWPGNAPPSPAELRAAIDALLKRDKTLAASQLAAWTHVAQSVSARQRFFHWPLEFADVFYDETGLPRCAAGFDAVIGNPPWEMLRKDAGADARDEAGPLVRFVRESGLYPSCGHGHLNLYQPFLDRALSLAHSAGRVGMIFPWGLAADDGASRLREKLLDRSRVHTIVGLDNSGAIFPVHRGLRFLVLVASPGGATGEIRARFGVRSVDEIENLPARENSFDATAYPVCLTTSLITKVGGAARRIPDARDARHLAFLRDVSERFPALGAATGWCARFGRELNATEDRASFGTRGLPVIEGKHIAPFVASVGGQVQKISRDRARARLPGLGFERARLAYRDVSSVSNRLSLIAAIVPAHVVTTHTLLCLRTPLPLVRQHFLCALFNSYVLNAVVRMLMGGHVTTSLVESLPVPAWTGDGSQRRIALLAHRIARNAGDTAAHAALQAAVARLYALDRQTFHAVLETFPLTARQERDRALHAFISME
ncbi:MAG TPA: N-6 DNA methylase [Vicinamibacterales bacterium]|nr:N-6 DNA methylase [Vicinamibacterales bacterium]